MTVATKWDTATGEMVIRCNAQTANDLYVELNKRTDSISKELVSLKLALGFTLQVLPK